MFSKLTVASIFLSLSSLVFAGSSSSAASIETTEAVKQVKPCFIEFNTTGEMMLLNAHHIVKISVRKTDLYITVGKEREVITYSSNQAALDAARRLAAKSQECK